MKRPPSYGPIVRLPRRRRLVHYIGPLWLLRTLAAVSMAAFAIELWSHA